MREISLSLPEIGMINSTRFIIGTGVGMLIAGKLGRDARKAVGFTLIAVGALVSIPVGLSLLGKLQGSHFRHREAGEKTAA
jgi:hypothetical protein